MTRVMLKARPTAAQLADRLREPRPDGLELYLDTADLATTEALDGVVRRLEACDLPSDFTLLVEGPIRSLDGAFFDLSRDSEADRELARRIVGLARRIGAVGANVHMIAPDPDPGALTPENRAATFRRAVGPARYFADLALEAGVVPTVENMPPILRMRESGFYYSAIGMPPRDLTELCAAVPGLRVVFDTSHAGLYLNVRRGVDDHGGDERSDGHDWAPLRRFIAEDGGPTTAGAYLDALDDTVFWCQIANAGGLLGEGLAYGEGDLDLDALLPALAARADYLVTETLEADNDHAVLMRDAQTRILRALGQGQVPSE
jgi:sugar phosphate isomerase/epimerase